MSPAGSRIDPQEAGLKRESPLPASGPPGWRIDAPVTKLSHRARPMTPPGLAGGRRVRAAEAGRGGGGAWRSRIDPQLLQLVSSIVYWISIKC